MTTFYSVDIQTPVREPGRTVYVQGNVSFIHHRKNLTERGILRMMRAGTWGPGEAGPTTQVVHISRLPYVS